MKWPEFVAAKERLGKTSQEVADILGVELSTVQRWKRYPDGLPGPASLAVRLLVQKAEHVPFQLTEKRKVRVIDGTKINAQQAAMALEKGASTYGFTLGQFSISDLIIEVLKKTLPADVIISTWTAANARVEHINKMWYQGRMKSCRFLLDPGFRVRQPEIAEKILAYFGPESVRTVANHAKFIVIRNDEWDVVIKTSMNLNTNPRLENYEICEGRELAEYMENFVDYIFKVSGPDENFTYGDYGGLHRKTGTLSAPNELTEQDLLGAL